MGNPLFLYGPLFMGLHHLFKMYFETGFVRAIARFPISGGLGGDRKGPSC